MILSQYARKASIGYLITTGLCIVLAIVYRILGHGIYSPHIRYLFTLPLFYFLVFWIIYKTNSNFYLPATVAFRGIMVSELARNVLTGVFEVYGTSCSKVNYLLWVSAAFIVATAVLCPVGIISEMRKRKKAEDKKKNKRENKSEI